MNWLSNKLFYTIGITLLCGGLHAQSLAEAKKLYNEGKYAEAKPAFEKLVKQAPSNSSYNHWYGVCCYETGDLVGAEKHLKVAVKRKVQEAYRYMSEVYYKTYRFDEAGEMLEEYINLLAKKKQDPQLFEAKLDLANNAQRMMEKVEDVQIIDSLVVDKDDFLSAYILSEESGTLDSYKDFFQTNEPVNSTVYKNQKGDKIYYAHSTDNDRYCLFSQSMLMDEWGDEKQLPMNINSNNDDNYPFVLSDGATIYYSSKGNGAIGGYDLFVTRYNTNSDTYLAPEQLGMPFNSPYNDYMMVFDEVKGLGWFVSDRFQPEGKACVYLFIPNPEHKRVESEDIEMKRTRAAITSIRDSWKEGSDYADLIRLSHTEIPYGEEKIEKDFDDLEKELHIKLGSAKDLIGSLSGGNQQKVVLAKWLDANPKVLVFDNPTQGVDVGAKEEIYDIILKLAEAGVAVIVLSSEAQEIIRVCDRTVVMFHGSVQGELVGDEMNEQAIMRLATGGQV